MENLAGGKYEWYPSPVEIGEKEIDTVTFIGENYEGRIHIAAADGHRIRGICFRGPMSRWSSAWT